MIFTFDFHVCRGCPQTPQPIALELNTWRQFSFTHMARFVPDTTGYLGGAGMVSLGAIFQRKLSNGSILVSVAGRGLEGLAGVAVLGN